ncbi:hypothetical protein LXA43DRAFT_1098968 [Ganoderma leucocontextum]|nr:hypothetical protein LXA43DRAFT_1098968 [Ganoderma leucocontextum]
MSAVLPPSWDGQSFGNMDIFEESMERWRKGCPRDNFWNNSKIRESRGLYSVTLFWDTMYITTDANIMKAVRLATQFQDFEQGEEFRDTLKDVLGKGVFNADDDMWKLHCTMTRLYFQSRDRIARFDMFDRHADFAIKMMKERFWNGHALDFQDLISRFTLDSGTEFLLGHCVHSLKHDLPHAHNDRPPLETWPMSKAALAHRMGLSGI